MAKEICISSTPHETRLAILEDDQLAEIYYERENEYTLAGSIYNGRVTRVLPGMQSAFVDIGLERDAFLYVTDFLELEDQEETEELEKAAVSGGERPPREVRHGRASQKPEEKLESAPSRERAALETAAGSQLEIEDLPETGGAAVAEPAAVSGEEPVASGAKRWRGRRRRRSSRESAVASEPQAEDRESAPAAAEEAVATVPEVAPEIHAAGIHEGETLLPETEAAASAAPAGTLPAQPAKPFVLPGESLSKYGGGAPAAAPAPEAPARPVSTFKPSTLIESPLEWSGSGLLPGESLSRFRDRQKEPAVEVHAEPQGIFSDAAAARDLAGDGVEQQAAETVEEPVTAVPEPIAESAAEPEEVEVTPEEFSLAASAALPVEPEELSPFNGEDENGKAASQSGQKDPEPVEGAVQSAATAEDAAPEAANADSDATASYKVDPLPPAGFRLFGLGGKKKSEEEAAKPAAAPAASTYAPGNGLVEEEIIEEEEYEAPRHPHYKAEENDLVESYEEEMLPNQMRPGEFGEMLQEAHFDHRLDMDLDEKSGEEEGAENEGAAEEQPAEGHAQHRERSSRGRRGRSGSAALNTRNGRGRGSARRTAQMSDLPIITDLLKPGQEILVQIAKEPIAKKGARITSHIALPGRFLVFMPTVNHIGVSRKISSEEERQRLKRILVHERGEATGGFIVRTAAEGASEEELRVDLRFLLHLWAEIKQRSEDSKSPALIYHDLSLIERILRDQVSSNFATIWVDSEANYERIVKFLNHFSPTMVRRVKLYTKETPLFEQFGIQDEISKALRSKVWLKSGGSIVINQTEALVAIDINTGKYVGKSARLEDTIVKTNLDAVPEIIHQIRLRDLGGIIVIDFIDMDDRRNRAKVMAALEEALKTDRAPTKVLQFNEFGLVIITRKRVKQSLERTLSVPCPICQATGMIKSPTTICNEIYTELRKMRKHFEGEDVLLRVHPETVKVLKADNATWISEFEELVGRSVLVKSDPTLHPEQFDIQG